MSRSADQGRLRRHVECLASVVRSERHDPDGMRRAWSYSTAHLAEAGWQVTEQPLSFSWRIGLADDVQPGGWWPIRVHRRLQGRNVLATPVNAEGPPPVIAAHVDTVKDCPGADDNASSVAVLLELATQLRERTDMPVLLAFLDMEEVGHFGGLALAKKLARSTGAIGMVNLEMVGYYSDEPGSQRLVKGVRRLLTGDQAVLDNLDGERRGDFPLVIHRKSSAFLARHLSVGAGTRGLPVVTLQDPRPEKCGRRLATFLVPATSNLDRSDHVPFWKRGIPAVMLCDTAHLRNANYHQPTDTADTLDYARLAAVADAVAHLVTQTLAGAATLGAQP
jgi:hypothetical protein